MMKRPTVLLVYGGESSEHDVSLASAKNVYGAVDRQLYSVRLCYIDKDGNWWLHDEWLDEPDGAGKIRLAVVPGTKTLTTVPDNEPIDIDVIFALLHGKNGEDGTMQGLAQMAHIPMVGCNVESSAVCMNKDVTKRLVSAAGTKVVPWSVVRPEDDVASLMERATSVSKTGPWFVKPSRAGSSVGVSKVTELAQLESAVATAFKHDTLVLIEAAVSGRELEVAILGNPPSHRASGVGEIIPGSEFYDYDDKYSPASSSRAVLNASLPGSLSEAIRKQALDAYAALGCTGLARVDFLLSDEQVPYMNEVNTLPGFTDISMYPKLWNEAGMTQEQLVSRLIELALE